MPLFAEELEYNPFVLMHTDDAGGWQISDDKAQRVKEAEEAAALHLQEFIDAAQKKETTSRTKLADYTAEITAVLKDGQGNNHKLTDRLQPIINSIVSLSSGRFRFMRMRSLWFLSSAIDGNRDNKSYYRLDSGREWIDRRVNHTDPDLKEKLLDAQKSIDEGRDALKTMAVTFVQGIKTIRSETAKRAEALWKAGMHWRRWLSRSCRGSKRSAPRRRNAPALRTMR